MARPLLDPNARPGPPTATSITRVVHPNRVSFGPGEGKPCPVEQCLQLRRLLPTLDQYQLRRQRLRVHVDLAVPVVDHSEPIDVMHLRGHLPPPRIEKDRRDHEIASSGVLEAELLARD